MVSYENATYNAPIPKDEAYKNLCCAIFEQAFLDIKSAPKRNRCNFVIVDDIITIQREIIKHPFKEYAFNYPLEGICQKHMDLKVKFAKGKHKYLVTDKKTGVHFYTYFNYHYPDYYRLKRRSDIDIKEVQPETCDNCKNAIYDSVPYGSTNADYLSGCKYEGKFTEEQADKFYNGVNCCPYWEG